jgi:glycosyltransferase involved in cell wall biosynthesis
MTDTTDRTLEVSVVVPVFNSASVVAQTVGTIRSELAALGVSFEIVLVDDGSRDSSWDVVSGLAQRYADVTAIRLLQNYGQHNANLAGLRAAKGEWVVTMDDDGQNPPDQIGVLIEAARGGHDVVFGRFRQKQSSRTRTLGSRVVGRLNRHIFGKPNDLTVSNFRVLHRGVVDRICADRTRYPYITGQALLYASSPANVEVEHAVRKHGTSNYDFVRILRLVVRILFSYSVAPLHVMAGVGGLVAVVSFVTGIVFLVRGVVGDVVVPGWTTLVVLLAFLQGITLLMLSMLGEYIVRTLNQVSDRPTYLVSDVVP